MTQIPTLVVKRDGSSAYFCPDLITAAIGKAGAATDEFGAMEAQRLSEQVVAALSGSDRPEVEQIQDTVERALFEAGYLRTLRAYIAYREQHQRLRADRKTLIDVEQSVNEYLQRDDWRVNANANQGYSLGGLILNTSGKMTANYWLNHVYPPEVGDAHRSGDIHIHDLDLLAGYCAGWSLRTFLNEGLNGVAGRVEAGPPRHLSSAIGQIVNFLGTMQNEWAGAQAFSSFDTYLAPYVRKDRLSYPEVRQNIQELIYNLNVPSRWGSQSPFINLTFDWVCPEDLREQVPLIAGEEMGFTYGELQAEMDMINRAYIEVMTEGDAKGRVFTFPIPTYNITPDFPWEGENAERLMEMTAKYGLPYFQNFVNSDLSPNMIRSMCCRLQLDLSELLKRGNGLFGSAEQTGSLGVVTVNCARLGYLHRGDEAGLFAALDRLLELGRDSLEIKRKVIDRHMQAGLFPYTQRYLGTLRNHFSTIGVNGIHELLRNFTADRDDLTTAGGREFALRLLYHIRARLSEFQEQTGHLYNLEATPAEGTTYRFAREDKKRYPDILQAGTAEAPYYTNSSQLPVDYTDDPFEELELQEALQGKYTGGTVVHLYMGERISSAEACKRLVRRALEGFRVPYLTITPTFSICPTHGYLSGEHTFCPHCDDALRAAGHAEPLADDLRTRCEVWTRVMGYHRPVQSWNDGKRAEHRERAFFEERRVVAEAEVA
ncbi:ribonucleoside triphosphate reductase [Halorhodospira halochloris]|uniref:ribonucleoside triphosphate reductase n=1 Tax=Halorhodospira halochloris TaxID=1052 RepID=UPI001EE837D3|nr:ribonucleoside triphosphate reductase [Halorhodospira halochloris]MCG5530495.1 ribonucleoside triphosphate reductase [Halorhodospira halochloris]